MNPYNKILGCEIFDMLRNNNCDVERLFVNSLVVELWWFFQDRVLVRSSASFYSIPCPGRIPMSGDKIQASPTGYLQNNVLLRRLMPNFFDISMLNSFGAISVNC